ncbi:MAG: AI-2E family transporter [Gammaproteobacteria bacterium]|nr:MAG: AI-2E family transporter [Gammaproteobacteria bacterium]
MLTEQRIYWLIIGVVFIYTFHLLSPILSPLFFSILLAYLGDPVADKLERHVSRTWAVVIVFLSILLILIVTVVIFIPLVSEQLGYLLGKLPELIKFFQAKVIPWLVEYFDYQPGTGQETVLNFVKSNLDDIPSLANKFSKWLTGSGSFVFTLLANVFLVPVVTFYLLRDWDHLMVKLRALLPRKVEPKLIELARESDEMLAAFLRGQFAVMNALGVIYAVGLSMLGLDSAILIGFIAGWLSFVPYLGLVIGIAVATTMAYFQFGDFMHPLGVVITFVIAQILEGAVLTPRFVGERIGLHPVAVIFAVLAGGQLGGFAGILLALPIAAVLNVIISHAQVAYQQSTLYNERLTDTTSEKDKPK